MGTNLKLFILAQCFIINTILCSFSFIEQYKRIVDDETTSISDVVDSLHVLKSNGIDSVKPNSQICNNININNKNVFSTYDLSVVYHFYKCKDLDKIDIAKVSRNQLVNFHGSVFLRKTMGLSINQNEIQSTIDSSLAKTLDVYNLSLLLHVINDHLPTFKSAALDSSIKKILKTASLIDDSYIMLPVSIEHNIYFFNELIKYQHATKSANQLNKVKMVKVFEYLRQAVKNSNPRTLSLLIDLYSFIKKIDLVSQLVFVEPTYYMPYNHQSIEISAVDFLWNKHSSPKIQIEQLKCSDKALKNSEYTVENDQSVLKLKFLTKPTFSSCQMLMKVLDSKTLFLNFETVDLKIGRIPEFSAIKFEINGQTNQFTDRILKIKADHLTSFSLNIVLNENTQNKIFLSFLNERNQQRSSIALTKDQSGFSLTVKNALNFVRNALKYEFANYKMSILFDSGTSQTTSELVLAELDLSFQVIAEDFQADSFFAPKQPFDIPYTETPTKSITKLFSLVFVGLVCCCFFGLFTMWTKIGFNSVSFSFSFWEILFHSSVISMLISFLLYWAYLDLFQEIKLVLIIFPTMLITGKQMVSSLLNQNL